MRTNAHECTHTNTDTHGEVAKGDISNGLRPYFPELDDDDEVS